MFSFTIDQDLKLRQLRKEDAAELFALIDQNRAFLSEWLSGNNLFKTQAEAENFIQPSFWQFTPAERIINSGVWYRGSLAGLVQLHSSMLNRTTIGYWLGFEYQGKGIITRSVKAVLDYAFGDLSLKVLSIYCAVDNLRSRKIPERLGFKLDRIEPNAEIINGVAVDDAVYSMTAKKWRDLSTK